MKSILSSNKKPYFLLGIGILAMSFSGIIIKLTKAPAPIIAFYRMAITAVILTPHFIRQSRDPEYAEPADFDKRLYLIPVLTGLVNTGNYIAGTIAVKETSIANTSVIGNLSPVWVGLAAVFIFKKKLSGRYWFGMGLALLGSLVVIGNNFVTLNFNFNRGDLCAVGSSIFYALYLITTERGRMHFSAAKFFCLMLYSSCFWLLLLNIILGNPFTGYDLQTWIYFFISALICQLIGQFSISAALGAIPAEIVSITVLLQPILITILAYPILGEEVGAIQFIGFVVTLAGVLIVNLEKARKENAKAA